MCMEGKVRQYEFDLNHDDSDTDNAHVVRNVDIIGQDRTFAAFFRKCSLSCPN